jgi:predicted MFS family arabinose efflux permease
VFHSRTERVEHAVDYVGAALLAGGLTCIVLFTSLGGSTFAWSSGETLLLIALSVVLLTAFVFAEARANEPILPLELFRNRIFTVCAAIGFIIGLALFGAVTYLPVFLQISKGRSPTSSGLQLTPMMAGLLVTSIASGRLISKWGKYRPFPIVGTAIMAVGMLLLSRLHLSTTGLYTSLSMLVLGLGLGMVMQVLVLAVQNAVDFRNMGVATSGSILFRQVGGSIGIAVFGAIFTNQLASKLRLPAGAHAVKTVSPAVVKHLPPAVHHAYASAVAESLHPVFVTAAFISIFAFLLTWLLREVPLRGSSPLDGEEITGAASAEAATVSRSPTD